MARRLNVPGDRSLAIVGAGWSGLAAAVRACDLGHETTLFEMAGHVGGRARSVTLSGTPTLDNGQHILIGAYRETLKLMAQVGADPERLLMRLPLELRYPNGNGLTVASGLPVAGFAWGVLRADGWSLGDRWQLLRTALGWWRGGMRNPGVSTVAQLCAPLPARIRTELIEPLCVAALNTPANLASASVFLRVLADALFDVPHGCDLLLPRATLSELFPIPAQQWLERRGGQIALGRRIQQVLPAQGGWQVDGESFHDVILACTAQEAARLTSAINPQWSARAGALTYEPIATVYLARRGLALPRPMMALHARRDAPAQFAFDLGSLGVADSTLAFVVSGARAWLEAGLEHLVRAVQTQALAAFPDRFPGGDCLVVHAAAERRATFSCTADLQRPGCEIAPGLFAAGDYVAGPYPSTLEGSVRSGQNAALLACDAGVRAAQAA